MVQAFLILLFAAFMYASISPFREREIGAVITYTYGLLCGYVYFVSIPMFLIVLNGGMTQTYFQTGNLSVEEDFWTFINIFIGWFVVLLVARFDSARRIPEMHFLKSDWLIFLSIIAILFLSPTITKMFSSGPTRDWYEDKNALMAVNPFVVIIENFSGVARTVVFGVLSYFTIKSKIRISTSIIMSIIFAIFCVVTSFNRISVLYAFFYFLVTYHRYWKATVIACIAAFPVASYLGRVWAVYRQIAFDYGFSWNQIATAFSQATAYMKFETDSFSFFVDGAFEAGNLLTFNYIVENYPKYYQPLYGFTFLLRPLTVFIPSAIWADKPPVFGSILGMQIQHNPYLSINSTIMGEAYANFLWVWPVALFLMLALYGALFRRLAKYSAVFNFCGFFVGFAALRFDIAFSMIALVMMVFLLVVTTVVFRFFSRTGQRVGERTAFR